VTYDVIIRDGLWFDGTGNAPRTRNARHSRWRWWPRVAGPSDGPLDETGAPR